MNYDLLVFAEIGGIFVGFAALIASTSVKSPTESYLLRAVVIFGLIVMFMSIVPVIGMGFGLDEHAAFRVSSICYLLLWVPITLLGNHAFKQNVSFAADFKTHRWFNIIVSIGFGITIIGMLLIIALGFFRQVWSGLYIASISLVLSQTALLLIRLLPNTNSGPDSWD